MSRFVRLVVPTYPHHMVQRGVRSMAIFSDDQDRLPYPEKLTGRDLMLKTEGRPRVDRK
ncbi:hypothetical protein [uncultured Desulfuromusa sp.]|uniref:hypothetical protein n=1 Tax=uncultured Desulfuromusa sp. TaxID=219183 RepID=UPI002AA842AF|nr:hypothetical protein [uncultured Desulfuromusa sp.]